MYLESERLTYKKFTPAHFENYFGLVSRQEVMRYITGLPLDYELAKKRFQVALDADQDRADMGFLAVFEQSREDFIGLAKIVPFGDNLTEIGYALLPEYWGKGYASEITARLIEYARQLGTISLLIALVVPENQSSIHVLTKQNFSFFREIREEKLVRHDYILYL
ncbi:GNAT family N-acetyltransferase [Dyadobacter sp. CY323]|uniref:GNAT family N-acetyltransferase n=1 Tax=Dyadobacter sp. CY323 TaxID=2907302 RepID=UPI001F23C70F|nr:GNAT family N-acetyltransferase [Dyadobacter sp. CY323]MCE6989610.1 GNAT family N-acetyltransferase [Dyadobacter sp. CY323]